MDMPTLTRFFMWCVIINGGLLVFWTALFIAVPAVGEFAYRTHSRWFPMSRETFSVVMYVFLGAFKLAWIVFNVVPYVALLIVGSG